MGAPTGRLCGSADEGAITDGVPCGQIFGRLTEGAGTFGGGFRILFLYFFILGMLSLMRPRTAAPLWGGVMLCIVELWRILQ